VLPFGVFGRMGHELWHRQAQEDHGELRWFWFAYDMDKYRLVRDLSRKIQARPSIVLLHDIAF
jgi:hypothetical protein